MRPEDKDYFTLAGDILSAMEQGKYHFDSIGDRRHPDKFAFLVNEENFSTEDVRYAEVGKLVSTLLMKQLSAEQRAQIPAEFDFAVTRHNGGAYFYFKTPDDFKLDFNRARSELDRIKNMFTPRTLEAINQGPHTVGNNRVCVGPFSLPEESYYSNVMRCLLKFHKIEGLDMKKVEGDVGTFLVYDRDEYAKVIGSNEMLKSFPMNQTLLSLPPPSPQGMS